mmetsp:Transcript_48032/g.88447  ORF Transcript_48032/g.88447 Transcript_48032/m.88447 type:complete len:114 (-) Transcript_48032:82-423(-)
MVTVVLAAATIKRHIYKLRSPATFYHLATDETTLKPKETLDQQRGQLFPESWGYAGVLFAKASLMNANEEPPSEWSLGSGEFPFIDMQATAQDVFGSTDLAVAVYIPSSRIPM